MTMYVNQKPQPAVPRPEPPVARSARKAPHITAAQYSRLLSQLDNLEQQVATILQLLQEKEAHHG